MEPTHLRFQRLLEPVHDRAVVFARSVCRSRADGDDLIQEALLRALDKLPSLRDDGAFKFWLYRVIISVHRNRYRQSFWRRLLPLEIEPAAPRAEDLGASERARLALAELLGVSASAIKSRLARGRDRLRSIYILKFGVEMQPRPALLPGESR